MRTFNLLHKNKKSEKYKGHYQIIKLKPHNNVEITISQKTNMIVNVNNLKPYHDDSKFQTFQDDFEK